MAAGKVFRPAKGNRAKAAAKGSKAAYGKAVAKPAKGKAKVGKASEYY